MLLSKLPSPSFIVHKQIFTSNCRKVAEEANRVGVSIRPHIKTHKTLEGILIQLQSAKEVGAKVTGFVASTINEVKLFARAVDEFSKLNLSNRSTDLGECCNVIYGVPIAQSRLDVLNRIRECNPSLDIHIIIDHEKQVQFVSNFVTATRAKPFSVFVKVDTGYHRAGVSCDQRGVKVAQEVLQSTAVKLRGLYSHWLVRNCLNVFE